MNASRWSLAALLLLLGACGAPAAAPAPDAAPAADAAGMGTLQVRANGEDFVRQGFVTKDGWQIAFDHVYVTLANVAALQTDPPFDATDTADPVVIERVALPGTHTVDLAAGDADAAPLLVGEVAAPAGRYNALTWQMVPAPEGDAAGAGVLLVGTATQDETTLPFRIALDMTSEQVCGDFVGDERKGILAADGVADVEATFHFDHIFGDGDAPADDPINTDAIGFAPFAALATNGAVDVDMATLREQLPPADLALLEEAHLPHVGEGHCRTTPLAAPAN